MIYLKNDTEVLLDVYIPRTVIYTGETSGGGGDLSNYWTSGETMDYVQDELEAYTPTDGFATINGQIITSGGNITIDAPEYSAGTNIDITNEVISVTGITVPTKVSDLQNDAGYITNDALNNYATLSDCNDLYTAVTQDIATAVSGLASETYVGSAITEATSGLAETSAVTQQIATAVSGLASETYVNNAVSGKQDTLISGTNIKTINQQSILGSGDITIQGGGAGAIEMTQAQYDALSGNVSADTFYVITDAAPIDMSNYATTGDLSTLSTTVSGKADAQNITANTNAYKFPKWNNQGVVNGEQGTAYQRTLYINGNGQTVYATSSGSFGNVYGPTSAGTAGDVCVSQGSGAPKWASMLSMLGVDFWIGSQDDYDDMASHSNTRLYIIDPDL